MKRDKRKERRVRNRILILCEGETEKNYFQAIKEVKEYQQILSALTVKVAVAKHPDAEHLVDEAIQLTEKAAKENNAYGQVGSYLTMTIRLNEKRHTTKHWQQIILLLFQQLPLKYGIYCIL